MARLVFKPGAVRNFAQSRALKSVRETTAAINAQAKRNAPGGSYSTGRLKASIGWSVKAAGFNVRGRSGSDLDYALFPERGARPHPIDPRSGPYMTFFWRRVGHVVRRRHVDHPGQSSQNFMTNALVEIAPRHGYKVTIYG